MKKYIWNAATCSCKNVICLASIIDNSVIACDEIIYTEETKTVTTTFNEKNVIFKTLNFYNLLGFLVITTHH